MQHGPFTCINHFHLGLNLGVRVFKTDINLHARYGSLFDLLVDISSLQPC